jgi:hypothetical protein
MPDAEDEDAVTPDFVDQAERRGRDLRDATPLDLGAPEGREPGRAMGCRLDQAILAVGGVRIVYRDERDGLGQITAGGAG